MACKALRERIRNLNSSSFWTLGHHEGVFDDCVCKQLLDGWLTKVRCSGASRSSGR